MDAAAKRRFWVEAHEYDSAEGRARLLKDVEKLLKRAMACLARGDHVGGETLARLAHQYLRATYDHRPSRPGPS